MLLVSLQQSHILNVSPQRLAKVKVGEMDFVYRKDVVEGNTHSEFKVGDNQVRGYVEAKLVSFSHTLRHFGHCTSSEYKNWG